MRYSPQMIRFLASVLCVLAGLGHCLALAASAPGGKTKVIFLVDSTSYMAAVFGDASKLAATKNALLSVLPVHAGKMDIGFLVYGHHISGQGSCGEVDKLSQLGPFAADAVNGLFTSLKTKGDAPVASALAAAFADRQLTDGSTAVVLIAGGAESCHADPCETAGKFAEGHDIPVDVIAIDAGGEADQLQSLRCVATNTKGNFWRVGSTLELAAALDDALAGILKAKATGGAAALPPQASGADGALPATGQAAPGADPGASAPGAAASDASVAVNALLTDAGPQLTAGLMWSVFASQGGPKGPIKLVASSPEATPRFKLPSGEYLFNVAYGRAYVTRTLKLAPGEQSAQLVINAGALKIGAHLADGSVAPAQLVTCDVYSDQRDQFGNRTKVFSGIKPGLVVRLNSGLYHVAATYGDANATVGADVGVEAGKITDAVFTLTGAKVTFKLVQQAGGEALTGTSWTISASGGEAVKHSLAALPTHILAAGNYTAQAERAGKKYTQDFIVKPSEPVLVEVQANAE